MKVPAIPVLTQFTYQQVALQEACWIGGEPYFTRRAIGAWLEYSPKIQDRAIAKIVERNPHIDQFSSLVNLTSELGTGKGENNTYTREQSIRVYNPIGLQLIVFESRQPKAKAYKVAVAHLVWAFMQGKLAPATPEGTPPYLLNIMQLPRYSRQRTPAIAALAEKLEKSTAQVRRYIRRVENSEPINKRPARGYTHKRLRSAREKVEALRRGMPALNPHQISKMVKIHPSTVYRWVKRAACNK